MQQNKMIASLFVIAHCIVQSQQAKEIKPVFFLNSFSHIYSWKLF